MAHLNYKFFYILILLAMVACNAPDVASNYVLTQDKYVKVLTDCYLAESAIILNLKPNKDSTYYFQVLKEHQISTAQFDSTVAYYARHPKLLKTVYKNVLNNLNAHNANYQKK